MEFSVRTAFKALAAEWDCTVSDERVAVGCDREILARGKCVGHLRHKRARARRNPCTV